MRPGIPHHLEEGAWDLESEDLALNTSSLSGPSFPCVYNEELKIRKQGEEGLDHPKWSVMTLPLKPSVPPAFLEAWFLRNFLFIAPAQRAFLAASCDCREGFCLPAYSLGLEKHPQVTLYCVINIRQAVYIYKSNCLTSTGETFTTGQKLIVT